jgi:hypothetical protein
MQQETWFMCGGREAGSVPFLVPSLFVGMIVTFRSGSSLQKWKVTSWAFLFSNHEGDRSGLLVEVEEM